jgi:RHS repeat-associated protein
VRAVTFVSRQRETYSYGTSGNELGQLTSLQYQGGYTVTQGTAPALSVAYDATTNRRTGECADANGNINSATSCTNGNVYDFQNRLVRNGGSTLAWAYSYAPGNKRVWRGNWSGSTQTVDEVTFWSITGQKLAVYNVSALFGPLVATSTGAYQYFGAKLIKNAGGYVNRDRLGSIGKFFPYGQERPSATTDGTEKFATYFRDSETGLDYAQNRYHQPGSGRFMTPDPAHSGSNWYTYAGGDPVNNSDPSGLDYLSDFIDATSCTSAFICGASDDSAQCVITANGQVCDERGVVWLLGQLAVYVPIIGIGDGNGNVAACFAGSQFAGAGGNNDCGTGNQASSPPLPSCDDLLAQWIDHYLSTYKGMTGRGSPLSSLGGAYFVQLGESTGV